MAIKRQTAWGGLVTLDMFFGGIGAGIFPVAFMLLHLDRVREMAHIGTLLGPIFVILGGIFLLLELGTPLNSYRVFSGLSTSWMSRGALIQIFYVIFGLGYSIPAIWLPRWLESGPGLTVGIIALILALVIASYHGLFLSEARGIPLWSSSILPLASSFTALATGLGLIFLMLLAYTGFYPNAEMLNTLSILGIAGMIFIVGELISIWSMLSLRSGITYTESVKTLGVPVIVGTICFIVSLILLTGVLWVREMTYLLSVSAVSGILLLAGGYLVRSSIIRAGHYLPLQIRLPQHM